MITVITRRVWKQILHPSLFTLLFMSLLACSDQNDLGSDSISGGTKTEDNIGIAFKGKVVSSQQATRADISIVHLGETNLKATSVSNYNVGIFGCHTGKYTWAGLVNLYAVMADGTISGDEYTAISGTYTEFNEYTTAAKLQAAAPKILKDHYTANLLYNTKATIKSDGSLTYEPVRFWPNNLLPGSTTQHEYCTFWAYYPYNPTAEIGDYGISLIQENIGEGTGMGRVKFTMQPDAANQNDFMISWPAVDCNRDIYPLVESPQGTYTPKPVSLRFFHMLAQVRLYAYIRGTDRMVYVQEDGKDKVTDETWFDSWEINGTIMDAWGNVYTKVYKNGTDATEGYEVERTTQKAAFPTEFATNLTKEKFLALGLKVPDESQCQRWERTNIWDMKHTRRRADISYQMEFNNIKTTTTFYPDYSSGKASIAYEDAKTLGSATVNNYIMNPYWFTFQDGKRIRLNDNYMFYYFEDTPVGKHLNASTAETLKTATDAADLSAYADVDGIDWSGLTYDISKANDNNVTNPMDVDPLGYLKNHDQHKELHPLATEGQHYNYAPGNILLVVPQKLDDDDVPHIVLTAKGNDAKKYTARLTINMLKMNIEWKSGYIYCYAILDDLRPGDDIVRGPESITTIFDTSQYTDQW